MVATATAAKSDLASTTVSCSFDFVVDPQTSATAASEVRSSKAYCYLAGSTGKKGPIEAVKAGLSAIELAVTWANHSSQIPDSKASPNEPLSSATSSRP